MIEPEDVNEIALVAAEKVPKSPLVVAVAVLLPLPMVTGSVSVTPAGILLKLMRIRVAESAKPGVLPSALVHTKGIAVLVLPVGRPVRTVCDSVFTLF